MNAFKTKWYKYIADTALQLSHSALQGSIYKPTI